ncbi:short chain dehydrogenase [Solimonas aquatica]|uniref:Short chain dehydrogenase n=1 Tax=Solimonas aquatica TaxID=489703 RepID=A0A1H9BNA8_9GAMM|nr:SDR family NAD(P)-dependent oxidoreductase [Solimonas aquatica]SEP90416.1 short chain dehydrogenase [Solimonas aquatica]
MNDNASRVVLVLDAQQTAPQAQARRLASQGAHVVLAASDWARAVDAALRLQLEGLSAEALHLPARDADSLRLARAQILKRHGRLDLVIDEAGAVAA